MPEIGRFNTLVITTLDADGAHFQTSVGDILLSAREIPDAARVGDRLRVFVYHDGANLLATLRTPLAQVGEFALLKVAQVTQIGAFLDWGLPKELLVPFSEQPRRMQAGRKYLVKICLDNRGRIVATGRLDPCLEPGAGDLKDGDEVELLIREFTDLGAKVIVNELYDGLLYRDELRGGQHRGTRLRGFVKHVREDGKIDVTLRRLGAEGIAEAQARILEELKLSGDLPLHDGSPPELIRERLGMSKKTFKRAVGGLYKEGLIEPPEGGIRLRRP